MLVLIRIQKFLKEICHCDIGSLRGNSLKIRTIVDLRLNKLKVPLVEVCALRVVLVGKKIYGSNWSTMSCKQ